MRISLSVGNADPVQRYLSYFRTGDEHSLPGMFKESCAPQWDMFCEHHSPLSKDPDRAQLYKVLEFLRYMKANRINPFIRTPVDPHTRRGLSVPVAYRLLAEQQLRGVSNRVKEDSRRLRLHTHMDPINSRFLLLDNGDHYVAHYSCGFLPKRNRSLDAVLPDLRGTIYRQHQIPPQFGNALDSRGRSTLPKSTALHSDVSDSQKWMNIHSKDGYRILARRGGDNTLVLKFCHPVPKEINFGSKTQTLNTILGLWKNVQPFTV